MSNPTLDKIDEYLDQCVARITELQSRIDNLKESGLDTDTKASNLRMRAENNELMLSLIQTYFGTRLLAKAAFLGPYSSVIRSTADYNASPGISFDYDNEIGYYQFDTRPGTIEVVYAQAGSPGDYAIVYEDTFNNFDVNPLVIYAGNKVGTDGSGTFFPIADTGKTGRLTINKKGAKGMLIPFIDYGMLGVAGAVYWFHIEMDQFNLSERGSFSIYSERKNGFDPIFYSEHFDGSRFIYGQSERIGITQQLPSQVSGREASKIKAMIVSGISEQVSQSMIIAPDRALKNAENTLIDLSMPLAANVDRITDVNISRINTTGYLYTVMYATNEPANPWNLAVFFFDTVDMARRGVSVVIPFQSVSVDMNSSLSKCFIKHSAVVQKVGGARVDFIIESRDGSDNIEGVTAMSIDIVTDVSGAPTSIVDTERRSTLVSPNPILTNNKVLYNRLWVEDGTDTVFELIRLDDFESVLFTINDLAIRNDVSMGTYNDRNIIFTDVVDSPPVVEDAHERRLAGGSEMGYIYGYSGTNSISRYPTRLTSNYAEAPTVPAWFTAPDGWNTRYMVSNDALPDGKLFASNGSDAVVVVYPSSVVVHRAPYDADVTELLDGFERRFTSPLSGIRDVVFLNTSNMDGRTESFLFAAIGDSPIEGQEKLYLCEVAPLSFYEADVPDEQPIIILDAIDVVEGSMIKGQRDNAGGKPLITVVRKDNNTLVTNVYQAYQSNGLYSWMMVF